MSRVQAAIPAGGSAEARSQRRQSAASSAVARTATPTVSGAASRMETAKAPARCILPSSGKLTPRHGRIANRDAGAHGGAGLASADFDEGKTMIRLDGKAAIVTGATRSIGEY